MLSQSSNSLISPWTLSFVAAVLLVIFLIAGRAQRREVGASIKRLWFTSALFAVLALTPAVPALLFGSHLDMTWATAYRVVAEADLLAIGLSQPVVIIERDGERVYRVPRPQFFPDTGAPTVVLSEREFRSLGLTEEFETRIRDGQVFFHVPSEVSADTLLGTGYSGIYKPVNVLALLMGIMLAVSTLFHVIRPVRKALKECLPLPLVEDVDVLEAVRALCDSMRVRVPRVLCHRTRHGDPVMQAATGGVLGTVIIASDGVLGHLEDAETAAILAHEIGHIKRRTVHWALLSILLALILMVLLSAVLFPAIAIPMGLVLIHAWRVIGHREELACDLLAAQAVGFVPTARALDKLHAANALPCGPLLRRIFYATQTHPAWAIRIEHLGKHASGVLDQMQQTDECRSQRRVSRAVVASLLAILAFAVWAGFDERLKWYGTGLLAVLFLLPLLFACLVITKPVLFIRQLGGCRIPWSRLLRGLLYVACFAASLYGLGQPWCWPSIVAVLLWFTTMLLARRRRRKWGSIDEAIVDRDFNAAIRLFRGLPRRVRFKASHRKFYASILLANGSEDLAQAELSALCSESPKYLLGKLTQAQVTSWRDPEAAIDLAQEVCRHVPDNPWSLFTLASCLARAGRFVEAEAALQEILVLTPGDGQAHVLAAVISSRAGDQEKTEQRLAEAEKREPTSTVIFLVRLRVLLAKGDLKAAGKALADAEEAVEENRMSLLMNDLGVLRDQFHEALRSA